MINYVTLFRRTEKKRKKRKYYSLVPTLTYNFCFNPKHTNKQNCHLKLTQILYVKKALGKGGDKSDGLSRNSLSLSFSFSIRLLFLIFMSLKLVYEPS